MTTRTQWFSIDADGQPAHVGWWEVRYETQYFSPTKKWWDGKVWRFSRRSVPCAYGNLHTRGEYWRGLAVKPKSGISSK